MPPYEAPVLAEPFPQRQESLDVTDMPGTKPLPEYVRHHVPIEHLGPFSPPSAMIPLVLTADGTLSCLFSAAARDEDSAGRFVRARALGHVAPRPGLAGAQPDRIQQRAQGAATRPQVQAARGAQNLPAVRN